VILLGRKPQSVPSMSLNWPQIWYNFKNIRQGPPGGWGSAPGIEMPNHRQHPKPPSPSRLNNPTAGLLSGGR
jgi:hypothetical protein